MSILCCNTSCNLADSTFVVLFGRYEAWTPSKNNATASVAVTVLIDAIYNRSTCFSHVPRHTCWGVPSLRVGRVVRLERDAWPTVKMVMASDTVSTLPPNLHPPAPYVHPVNSLTKQNTPHGVS